MIAAERANMDGAPSRPSCGRCSIPTARPCGPCRTRTATCSPPAAHHHPACQRRFRRLDRRHGGKVAGLQENETQREHVVAEFNRVMMRCSMLSPPARIAGAPFALRLGYYGAIMADVPARFKQWAATDPTMPGRRNTEQHYPTLSSPRSSNCPPPRSAIRALRTSVTNRSLAVK